MMSTLKTMLPNKPISAAEFLLDFRSRDRLEARFEQKGELLSVVGTGERTCLYLFPEQFC